MQDAKLSRLADSRRDAALVWLARQLRWERTLEALRSDRGVDTRRAA